jgi:hypothetical protein
LAAGLVTVDAPPFEDWENILLEARFRRGGACRVRVHGKGHSTAERDGQGQPYADRKMIPPVHGPNSSMVHRHFPPAGPIGRQGPVSERDTGILTHSQNTWATI